MTTVWIVSSDDILGTFSSYELSIASIKLSFPDVRGNLGFFESSNGRGYWITESIISNVPVKMIDPWIQVQE